MAPISKNIAVLSALFAAIGSAMPIKSNNLVPSSEADSVDAITDANWKIPHATPTVNLIPSKSPAIRAVTSTDVPGAQKEEQVEQQQKQVEQKQQQQQKQQLQELEQKQQKQEQQQKQQEQQVASAPQSSTVQPPTTTPAASSSPSNEEAPAPPKTTTEAAPAPTAPAPTAPAPTAPGAGESKEKAPAPAPKKPAGGNGGGACSADSPCSGDGTFYDVATSPSSPSSCGNTSNGSKDNVIALPHGMMKDSDCGRSVTVSFGGKSAVGKVVDKCMGCNGDSIDLSRHFFGELASFDLGRLSGIKWHFN